nr:hypothetical protein [Candidatus Sigynarchaeota archaeon]MDO8114700.1 hypothetical protein [Candidatus Sigynarchaeota archaeon]
RDAIMDQIVFTCKKCGRPLVATVAMKTRKCAACGAVNPIHAFRREHPVPISEAAGVATAKAKKTEEPGKPQVIKRRTAKPGNADGDEP